MGYNFNPQLALDEAVEWVKTQAEEAKFTQVVLGISGGKDSTIAAAICCRALGKENVHGLLLPNNIQSDIQDSIDVCNALGIKYDTINIKPMYDAFLLQYAVCTSKQNFEIVKEINVAEGILEDMIKGVKKEQTVFPSDAAKINLAPRIRMTLLRLWGQSNHHRLCGTGNLSEITVGYCTKDGDTSCDFNPLGGLTSIEVVEVGKLLEEIPQYLVTKTPSDGLCGMSDEENLGVKYMDIHRYIRGITMLRETWDVIHKMELASLHKKTNAPKYIPSDRVFGK